MTARADFGRDQLARTATSGPYAVSISPVEWSSRQAALLFVQVSEKRGVTDVAERAFRRHYGHVYRYLRRRTGDHHRAEDLTQQVFADAVASLRETESSSLAWLYTVAQRRFADEVRRGAAGQRLGALQPVAHAGARVRSRCRGRACERVSSGCRRVSGRFSC